MINDAYMLEIDEPVERHPLRRRRGRPRGAEKVEPRGLVTATLTKSAKQTLKRLAEAHGTSMSGLASDILMHYLTRAADDHETP